MDTVRARFGGIPCRCGFAEAEALGRDRGQGDTVNEEFKASHTVDIGGVGLKRNRPHGKYDPVERAIQPDRRALRGCTTGSQQGGYRKHHETADDDPFHPPPPPSGVRRTSWHFSADHSASLWRSCRAQTTLQLCILHPVPLQHALI